MPRRKSIERLLRMIEHLKRVERSGTDPFSIDVEYFLELIREYFKESDSPEGLKIDGEAIDAASTALALQTKRLEYMSASLYRDPFLVEQRLKEMSRDEIVSAFLRSWHPLVAIEQMSERSFANALGYWDELLPIKERLAREVREMKTRTISTEELLQAGLASDESLLEAVEGLWEELKETGKVEYWDFIATRTYRGTLRRAILVSFLVTRGFAELKVDPIEDVIVLSPERKRRTVRKEQSISIPISIAEDRWREAIEKKG
ncbi:MAG: hypothetical protein ACE5OY_07685 [Candidatus Bathyarchaeia archaeon]